MSRIRSTLIGLCLAALLPGAAFAQGFVVSDIRVEGLQRIAAGSVFAAMPIAVGDLAQPSILLV